MVAGFCFFGQILGLITGAGTISIASAPPGSATYLLNAGINSGLADAIFWAAAFSIGERLAGARAAVMGSLIGTAFKNVAPTVWAFLPLISIWTTYAVVRHRSLARARNAPEALAGL